MNVDAALQEVLKAGFAPLDADGYSMPAATTLSDTLGKLVPSDGSDKAVSAKVASYFYTAAIDIWLRGVHSFLVSAALTDGSPIWSSVSGYYSSHYTVRGLAHLLGIFQLFHKRKIVQLRLESGKYHCKFIPKNAGDAEHKLYWKLLKQSPTFKSNELFTDNNADKDASDIRHRSHANYADHLFLYERFQPLNEDALKERIEYISKIAFDTAPLPRLSHFPDIEYVQLIAYHRIVWFRSLLDEVLGGKNKFWNEHRNPLFAKGLMDFQLVEGSGLIQPE